MQHPDLELVACGSSAVDMPTFGEWERVVLTETYDQVDLVSIYRYDEEKHGDLAFTGSVTGGVPHSACDGASGIHTRMAEGPRLAHK